MDNGVKSMELNLILHFILKGQHGYKCPEQKTKKKLMGTRTK